MFAKYMLVLVLIFNIFLYVYGDEENPLVVLWYPIPVNVQKLLQLAHEANLTKCHRHILETIIPDKLALPAGYSNTSQYIVATNLFNSSTPENSASNSDVEIRIFSNPAKIVENKMNFASDQDTNNQGSFYYQFLGNSTQDKRENHNDGNALALHMLTNLTTDNYDYAVKDDNGDVAGNKFNTTIHIGFDTYNNKSKTHNTPNGEVKSMLLPRIGDFNSFENDDHHLSNVGNQMDMRSFIQDYLFSQVEEQHQDTKCNCSSFLTKLLNHYLNESYVGMHTVGNR